MPSATVRKGALKGQGCPKSVKLIQRKKNMSIAEKRGKERDRPTLQREDDEAVRCRRRETASYLLDLMCISFSGMNLSLGLKRLSSRGKIRLMLEESAFAEILNVISHAVKICCL